MILSKTRSTLNQIIRDFKKLSYRVTIAVSTLFIFFYMYKIWIHWGIWGYFAIYCILFAISIASFILCIVTHNKKRTKGIKWTKWGFRISKYLANFSVIIVTLFEFVQKGAIALDIIFTCISIFCLMIQVVVEITRILIEKYGELLYASFLMDIEPYKNVIQKITDPKSAIIDFFNKPFSRKKEEPLSPQKEKILQIEENYKSEIKKQKQENRMIAKNEFKSKFRKKKKKEEVKL